MYQKDLGTKQLLIFFLLSHPQSQFCRQYCHENCFYNTFLHWHNKGYHISSTFIIDKYQMSNVA
jgi:hypothetical protein